MFSEKKDFDSESVCWCVNYSSFLMWLVVKTFDSNEAGMVRPQSLGASIATDDEEIFFWKQCRELLWLKYQNNKNTLGWWFLCCCKIRSLLTPSQNAFTIVSI